MTTNMWYEERSACVIDCSLYDINVYCLVLGMNCSRSTVHGFAFGFLPCSKGRKKVPPRKPIPKNCYSRVGTFLYILILTS